MFKQDDNKEGYVFETEKLKGRFEPGGPYSGIRSLIHKDEGTEWVGDFDSGYPGYDIPPGVRLYLLSFYHYLGKNLPHLILGRNMPGKTELVDGSIILNLGPLNECNTHTKIKMFFTDPETLDLDISLTAHCLIEDMEVCLSSYTVNRKWGSPYYYLLKQPANEDDGTFIQPKDTPFLQGWYHSSPRDNRTAAMLYDGRWPGDKYQIHITGPYFKYPILVSRNPETGIALIQMAEYETCSRVGSLYSTYDNRIYVGFNKKGIAYSDDHLRSDYSPTYFYLFGDTFEPGMMKHSRFRMILKHISEDFSEEVLALYKEFI